MSDGAWIHVCVIRPTPIHQENISATTEKPIMCPKAAWNVMALKQAEWGLSRRRRFPSGNLRMFPGDRQDPGDCLRQTELNSLEKQNIFLKEPASEISSFGFDRERELSSNLGRD